MINSVRKTVPGKVVFLMLALVITPISAHEFWLDLERGRLEPGGAVIADLKVGQMLKGESYPYLSKYIQSFTVTNGGKTTTVTGNEGDLPALNYITQHSGLHTITHETVAFRVTYDDPEIFQRYLREEGLDGFADLHRQRGLPEAGFSERYTRCVKALVQVGPVTPYDVDVAVGMPLELVAENNPYDEDVDQLTVKLLWQGKPLANWQINLFHDAGAVARTELMTDELGRAMLPLTGGEYLLNAVQLEPVDDSPVVWQSYWATLSFKLGDGV